ncbi:MAG: hypothetical protein OJF59_000233 [Cytophagales bacterium]|jgi:hypothetical protein|nr:YfiR family protein [Bacteroidota bacterium]MBS1982049.1 YfiR family protein [Bacteroidota bacterium]WHZ06480.1 MAG: hypothetical protein OJF59_000233 [Cytophagales bacterium]
MKKSLCIGLVLWVSAGGYAQQLNYQTISIFMYSFTKFVQWPEEANTGNFEMVVLGNSSIITELKSMAEKKKAGTRIIEVTKISSLAEFKKANVLYVSNEWVAKHAEVAAKIGDQPTLIVTEQATGAMKGDINFYINKEGKLAFEINSPSVTKHRLKVSADLVRFASTN